MPLEIDICATLGHQFIERAGHLCDDLTGQDCYEILTMVLEPPVTLEKLQNLEEVDFQNLRTATTSYLELEKTPEIDFESIVAATLVHWE